eukprot:m.234349 g.234349  ORF g.234349 m.234349 type:complete len:982 (+) comp19567_c0_seq1:21-2966(+)
MEESLFQQLTSLVSRINHVGSAPLSDPDLYQAYLNVCSLCSQLKNYPTLAPEKLAHVRKVFLSSLQNAELLKKKLDGSQAGMGAVTPAQGQAPPTLAQPHPQHTQRSHSHQPPSHPQHPAHSHPPSTHTSTSDALSPTNSLPPPYAAGLSRASMLPPAPAYPGTEAGKVRSGDGVASCCAFCSKKFEEQSFFLFVTRIPMHSCHACHRQFCDACIVLPGHPGAAQLCVLCDKAEKEATLAQQRVLQNRLRYEAEERRRQAIAQQELHAKFEQAQADLARQQKMVEEQQAQLGALRLQREAEAAAEQQRARAAAQIAGLGFSELEARVALEESRGDVMAAVNALHQRMQMREGVTATISCRDLAAFEIRQQSSQNEFIAFDRERQEEVTMTLLRFDEGHNVEANIRARLVGVGTLTAEFGSNLPAILPIHAVVYIDRGCYLIQPVVPHAMPLTTWLAEPREPALVKSALRQILQAMLHLHARRVPFVLTSPDDVIVASEPDAVDLHVFLKHSPASGHVRSETAPPEWSDASTWTPAADIYVFGCLLFNALTMKLPILLPGQDRVQPPFGCPDAARTVLEACLTREPSTRPTAAALLLQPFFVGEEVMRLRADGDIPSTDRKLAALQDHIQSLEDRHNRLHLHVRRTHIIESTCQALISCSASDLRKKLSMHFEGESGVDAGGLTKELFSSFFNTLFLLDGPGRLFERSGADGMKACFLPSPLPDDTDLHVRDSRLMLYEGVGRLIGKALFDRVTVLLPLCPSVFKFLLDLPPTFTDLEAYDPILATNYRALMTAPDASVLGLAFDEFGDPDRLVTNATRNEYVDKCVERHLVGLRREPLQALRRGFASLPIYLHVKLLTWAELATLLQGSASVTPAALLAVTDFQSFSRESRAPMLFKDFVNTLDEAALRRLLCFVTATATLPSPATPLIVRARTCDPTRDFPVAHTCFNTLDLPDYASADLLRQRMQYCLDHLEDSGFGIA